MDEPRIAVEGEDDRFVLRKQRVEVEVAQAVRMLTRRLQLHEIHDVDDTHLQFRYVLADKRHRRECFERRHIAATRHHHIGLAALVIAGPFPDADAGAAMLDRLVHRQPHGCGLFAGHDHIDVIAAAQAMVGDGKQAVRIGRQIDAHDLGFLVHDVVDEAGILMREPVVVLAPDVRTEQVVERRDRAAATECDCRPSTISRAG